MISLLFGRNLVRGRTNGIGVAVAACSLFSILGANHLAHLSSRPGAAHLAAVGVDSVKTGTIPTTSCRQVFTVTRSVFSPTTTTSLQESDPPCGRPAR